jgi:hypothetical protein
MIACPHTHTIGLGCQTLEHMFNEIQIERIGFVSGGRELLNSQEHIFTESLEDVLSLEQKLELHKKKYFARY